VTPTNGEDRKTGIGWPGSPSRPYYRRPDRRGPARPVPEREPAPGADPIADLTADLAADLAAGEPDERRPGVGRRWSTAGIMIAVLLAGLGFTLVVQLRNVSEDPTLAGARQEDLVRILSDLQAREQRLRADIAQLEESQRQLASGVEGGQAALEEATRRADELGILAGSLPATGPGLLVRFEGNADQLKARAVLDAVQELRGAGAEAMQISGLNGSAVRIVNSTYFLDGRDGIDVDGTKLTAPYTIAVIGDPQTMRTALNIPGGVAELVGQDGGTVTMDEVSAVAVTTRHGGTTLQYARPVP
jgi:uncharacterized protein YlxW (UPF0749 family)